jgi:hypothetical protein
MFIRKENLKVLNLLNFVVDSSGIQILFEFKHFSGFKLQNVSCIHFRW